MSVAQRVTLTIDADKVTPQITPKNDLYQGDKNANEIEIELVRGGEPVTLSGYTAAGSMERSDGNQVPCTGKIEGNKIIITLNEHCYVYEGPYTLDIELSGGGEELRRTIAQITGTVRKTANGPIVEVEEEIVDVDAVIALYGEMKTAKNEAVQATTAANNAAGSANTAAAAANSAARSAAEAATSASGAAQAATTAAGNANKAATNATNAAGAANQAAGRAENVASKSPYIGDNGNWYVYDVDAGEYVDSGRPSRGATGAVEGLDYYEGNPSALGTASPGTANGVARGDHVHPMPTAAQVGARPDNWMPTADDISALATSDVLDTLYPVGIIVPFANTVEPAAIWGGTWDLLEEGQTLIQSGSQYALGSTGGETTHTLTVDEIPPHRHYIKLATKADSSSPYLCSSSTPTWSDYTVDSSIASNSAGGGLPHNNLPPYLAVNLWKRTA